MKDRIGLRLGQPRSDCAVKSFRLLPMGQLETEEQILHTHINSKRTYADRQRQPSRNCRQHEANGTCTPCQRNATQHSALASSADPWKSLVTTCGPTPRGPFERALPRTTPAQPTSENAMRNSTATNTISLLSKKTRHGPSKLLATRIRRAAAHRAQYRIGLIIAPLQQPSHYQ